MTVAVPAALRLHIEDLDLTPASTVATPPGFDKLNAAFAKATGWTLMYRPRPTNIEPNRDSPSATADQMHIAIDDMSADWPAGRPTVNRKYCEDIVAAINDLLTAQVQIIGPTSDALAVTGEKTSLRMDAAVLKQPLGSQRQTKRPGSKSRLSKVARGPASTGSVTTSLALPMPSVHPAVDGLSLSVRCAGSNARQARLFDWRVRSDDCLVLLLADLPQCYDAMWFGGQLQTAFRCLADYLATPAALLTKLDQLLWAATDEPPVQSSLGIMVTDPHTGDFALAAAGNVAGKIACDEDIQPIPLRRLCDRQSYLAEYIATSNSRLARGETMVIACGQSTSLPIPVLLDRTMGCAATDRRCSAPATMADTSSYAAVQVELLRK